VERPKRAAELRGQQGGFVELQMGRRELHVRVDGQLVFINVP
jgi:hypothetical protein